MLGVDFAGCPVSKEEEQTAGFREMGEYFAVRFPRPMRPICPIGPIINLPANHILQETGTTGEILPIRGFARFLKVEKQGGR
jgi:hypothetical protein